MNYEDKLEAENAELKRELEIIKKIDESQQEMISILKEIIACKDRSLDLLETILRKERE